MARCETVDVEGPASVELIIEGIINPGETADEGPFGEFSGFYTSQTKTNDAINVFDANGVTRAVFVRTRVERDVVI